MEYRTPYPWYIDPPIHGTCTLYIKPPNTDILTPTNPWYLEPLLMVKWSPYPWNIEPLIHGISNPTPMVFSPPTHGTSNTLHMVFWTSYPWYIEPPLLVLWTQFMVQFTMMGFKILWQKFGPVVKISYGILTPGLIFQGFKIPYDTGFSVVCVARYLILFLFFGRLLYPFVIFFLLAIVLSIIRFMAPLIFSNCSYLLHVVLFLCSKWFFLIIAKTRT
jgi:hypothetical protein